MAVLCCELITNVRLLCRFGIKGNRPQFFIRGKEEQQNLKKPRNGIESSNLQRYYTLDFGALFSK